MTRAVEKQGGALYTCLITCGTQADEHLFGTRTVIVSLFYVAIGSLSCELTEFEQCRGYDGCCAGIAWTETAGHAIGARGCRQAVGRGLCNTRIVEIPIGNHIGRKSFQIFIGHFLSKVQVLGVVRFAIDHRVTVDGPTLSASPHAAIGQPLMGTVVEMMAVEGIIYCNMCTGVVGTELIGHGSVGMADGYLPLNTKTDGSVLSNIEYEPYMFRIFVESPNGNLRHFTYETDDNGNRVITAKEGSTTGPWCVWSEYLTLDENGDPVDNTPNGVTFSTSDGVITFKKDKVNRDNPANEWTLDEENAIFGALTSIETGENQAISEDDLTIYVHYYYKSTGKPIESMNRFMLRADGADVDKSFYAVEKKATTKQGPTAVEEIRYHGEVVSTTYYNVQGMKSDKPFDGVNIVVTRFSDGATSISKVVR